MPRDHVIFFRNISTAPGRSDSNKERDPYESAVELLGYIAHTQPVLAQEFVNAHDLVRIIGSSEEWTGVVATSKRAGEAWVNALRHFSNPETIPGEYCLIVSQISLSLTKCRVLEWDNVPLYTPGIATTTAFAAQDLPAFAFPTIVVESQATGCAELLGPFIVSDLHARRLQEEPSSVKPLLVLTGDKNSSELTDILQCHEIAYQEFEVYRTCPRSDIRQRLEALIEEIVAGTEKAAQEITIWLAFFSPSSAEAVLLASPPSPSTEGIPSYWHQQLAQDAQTNHGKRVTFRMAAIGKTTRHYLQGRGFEGVVQAERPNAECLARAIAGD
jgi:uroporphyrinogen-III synthase